MSEEHLTWLKRWGKEGIILRRKMAEIARPAALRLPPFDSLPLESCLNPYKTYLDRKTNEEQAVLMDAFIKFMEFIIGGEVCRDKHAMETWAEIDDEYQRNFAINYVPPPIRVPEIKNSEARKIVVERFKQGWPEFAQTKSDDRNTLRLIRPNIHVEAVKLDFDFGTFGPGHFTPYIGTVEPRFGVELTSILCVRKRRWDFDNAEQCAQGADAVIGLAKLLMPMFEEKISTIPIEI